MTFGDKLSKLRREHNYTQEQLADVLGVSRQAISKWESNLTFPETDKLIRISELFDCSLDYLLKDSVETDDAAQADTEPDRQPQPNAVAYNPTRGYSPFSRLRDRLHERKSDKELFGMPLWHIGTNAQAFVAVGLKARGVIAVGLYAKGILSLGVLSIGALSFGLLPIGLLAIGMLAFGILAAGNIAVGVIAAGAISFGIISLGAVAIGDFSVGALAIGRYFARGDHARAMIAVGDTEAAGSVFQKIGELTARESIAVKNMLDTIVPAYLSWAKDLIASFLP